MVTTLLVLSLLLHVVTFYIIMVLVQRMNSLKGQTGVDTTIDLEEILKKHLDDVRAENQALISQLDQNKRPLPFSTPKPVPEKVKTTPVPSEKTKEIENTYTPPVSQVVDQVERSMTAEVLHLYNTGLTSDLIARKLNIGKGEVELMINLNKKKHSE